MSVKKRIAEIKVREQAATEGPWINFTHHEDEDDWIAHSVCEKNGPCSEDCPNGAHCHNCLVYQLNNSENAEFIAWSREDIPWLLEELEKALDKVDAYETLSQDPPEKLNPHKGSSFNEHCKEEEGNGA